MKANIIHIKNSDELLKKIKTYKNWKEDNEFELLNPKGWSIQQSFGKCYFVNEMKFETLVLTDGKRSGFDGIFKKEGKVFLYESKSCKNCSIRSLLTKSIKTIKYVSREKVSEIKAILRGAEIKNKEETRAMLGFFSQELQKLN